MKLELRTLPEGEVLATSTAHLSRQLIFLPTKLSCQLNRDELQNYRMLAV